MKNTKTKKLTNIIAMHLGFEKTTKQNTLLLMQKIWRNWEDLRDYFGFYELKDCWDYLKSKNPQYYKKIMED